MIMKRKLHRVHDMDSSKTLLIFTVDEAEAEYFACKDYGFFIPVAVKAKHPPSKRL